MKIKCGLMMLFLAVALFGCRRTDVRDFTVDVPGLTKDNARQIAMAVIRYDGVVRDSLKFDYEKHCVQLKYDSMKLAKKNIEMEIAKLGYVANGVTPESIGVEKK